MLLLFRKGPGFPQKPAATILRGGTCRWTGSGFKEAGGAGFEKHLSGELAEGDGPALRAARLVMDANRFPFGRVGHDGEALLPLSGFVLRRNSAMDADGNLAAPAKCGKGSAFGRDGEAGGRIVEEANRAHGRGVVPAGLDAQRTLAGGRTEEIGFQAFAHPLSLFEPIQACGG